MGISGLLPLLKGGCARKTEIGRCYKGQTVGIDASTWLHRGAYGCARELALGKECSTYVRYFMRLVAMLKHNGIKPYVVFDGAPLPAKALTNQRRREQRQAARAAGMEMEKTGNVEEATVQFQKCITVTHEMVLSVIVALKADKVDYVVAPYEADAQLAFLYKNHLIDAVITEDSDLACYGCKKIFTKMDQYGSGVEVDLGKLGTCSGFGDFKDDMFLDMCILSGCDYVDSVPGVGLKTGQKLIKRWRTITRVAKQLKFEKKCDAAYLEDVERAKKTFLHHWVYDPRAMFGKQMVSLSGRDSADVLPEELEFLGPFLGKRLVQRIAHGELDPKRYEEQLQKEEEEKEDRDRRDAEHRDAKRREQQRRQQRKEEEKRKRAHNQTSFLESLENQIMGTAAGATMEQPSRRSSTQAAATGYTETFDEQQYDPVKQTRSEPALTCGNGCDQDAPASTARSATGGGELFSPVFSPTGLQCDAKHAAADLSAARAGNPFSANGELQPEQREANGSSATASQPPTLQREWSDEEPQDDIPGQAPSSQSPRDTSPQPAAKKHRQLTRAQLLAQSRPGRPTASSSVVGSSLADFKQNAPIPSAFSTAGSSSVGEKEMQSSHPRSTGCALNVHGVDRKVAEKARKKVKQTVDTWREQWAAGGKTSSSSQSTGGARIGIGKNGKGKGKGKGKSKLSRGQKTLFSFVKASSD
jgi:exonuclease-1